MRFVDGFQTKAGLRSAWFAGDVSAQQSPGSPVPHRSGWFFGCKNDDEGGFGKKMPAPWAAHGIEN